MRCLPAEGVETPPAHPALVAGRLGLAAAIVIVELSWHAWAVSQGIWSLQLSLPLHACSVGLWTSVYILLTRNYRAYEIIFFIGIAVMVPVTGAFGMLLYGILQDGRRESASRDLREADEARIAAEKRSTFRLVRSA